MGDIVNLRSVPLENDELISDLARFADGTLTREAVKSRHRLTEADWTALGEDDALVRAIESEKLRRIRSGQTKKERAQLEIIDGPPILGRIMRDPNANERHRIDLIKALDALAGGSSENAAKADQFIIQINLGDDHIETYNKSKRVLELGEVDPDDPSSTPQGVIAAIAVKKPTENDGGCGHI